MEPSLFVEGESPVDFLYLDRQRIASLIGQLSDRGMLTGTKSVTAKSHTTEGGGALNATIVKLDGKHAKTTGISEEETYDPFWAHAFSFLQDLEGNFAVRLEIAQLGSLVKFEALLQLIDLEVMRELWEPSM